VHRRRAAAEHPDYDPSTLLVPRSASLTPFAAAFWGIKARAMDVVLFVKCVPRLNPSGTRVQHARACSCDALLPGCMLRAAAVISCCEGTTGQVIACRTCDMPRGA
jgi:hypothetical protein